MNTSEHTTAKIDVLRKKIDYQNHFGQQNFPSESFQTSETNQTRSPLVHTNFGYPSNSASHASAHQNGNLRVKPNYQQGISLKQANLLAGGGGVYSMTKRTPFNMTEGEKCSIKQKTNLENGCEQTYTSRDQTYSYDQNCLPLNKQITYQNQVYDIAKGSSYICHPVSNKKDLVRVNDLVVKDGLILCCKPRTHRNVYNKLKDEEGDTCDIEGFIETEKLKGDKIYDERVFECMGKSRDDSKETSSVGSRFAGPGSGDSPKLFFQRHSPFHQADPHEKTEVERKIHCTKLSKKFKCFLWTLFFLSIFLVIIGSILLTHTLFHFIARNYINIVIEHSGFVKWIWVMMIISILIIVVGIYGIITSIDRSRRILTAYSTAAFIMAVLILIFLLFMWMFFIHTKDIENESLRNTFKIYRCNRYFRTAWDDLQETHKCCGIEDQEDWKYIPTSCCNGTTKPQKMKCLKHYIKGDQAFNDGCKSKLEHYFFTFFGIGACLLFLVLILLILSLIAASWLLGRYRKVRKCQEIYYVSR